jgi:hypothetical protein
MSKRIARHARYAPAIMQKAPGVLIAGRWSRWLAGAGPSRAALVRIASG